MRNWLLATLVVAGVVVVSMLFIDGPMARFTAELGLFRETSLRAAAGMPVMIVAACLAALAGIRQLVVRRPLPKPIEAGMLAGWGVMATVCAIELVLKPAFGRAPPVDFVLNGHYGFHPFDWSRSFTDVFPSGHAGQAAAIVAVLWMYYPRWRWLYAAGMVVLAIALMLGAWHFFSDIVAGAYVGAVMGALAMWVWRALRPEAARRG